MAVVALGFYTSARVAEQVRAGIGSRAGPPWPLALGLTLPQTYGFVLLPMAYRIMLPPLTRSCSTSSRTKPLRSPSTYGTHRARTVYAGIPVSGVWAFTAATVIYVINIVDICHARA